MKTSVYILSLSLLLSACTGSSSEDHGHSHEEGTHTHEDGSTHADHEAHEQEEFSVTDSTAHDQLHEEGVEHNH